VETERELGPKEVDGEPNRLLEEACGMIVGEAVELCIKELVAPSRRTVDEEESGLLERKELVEAEREIGLKEVDGEPDNLLEDDRAATGALESENDTEEPRDLERNPDLDIEPDKLLDEYEVACERSVDEGAAEPCVEELIATFWLVEIAPVVGRFKADEDEEAV